MFPKWCSLKAFCINMQNCPDRNIFQMEKSPADGSLPAAGLLSFLFLHNMDGKAAKLPV